MQRSRTHNRPTAVPERAANPPDTICSSCSGHWHRDTGPPMADRTVWRWCAEWNPPLLHRLEHEHRDLPVRPRLVRRVVGPGLDRVLPPDSLLVARDLARRVVALGRAVLQLDVRGLLEVRVPGGILRGAAE